MSGLILSDHAQEQDATIAFSGVLDNLVDGGVVGWCFEKARPEIPSQLSVLLDGLLVIEGETLLSRPDLDPFVRAKDCTVGFHIPVPRYLAVNVLSQLIARYDGDLTRKVDLVVGVRSGVRDMFSADTEYRLQSADAALTRRRLSEWLAVWDIKLDPEILSARTKTYGALRETAQSRGRRQVDNKAELFKTSMKLVNQPASPTPFADREQVVRQFLDADFYIHQDPPLPEETDAVRHYLDEGFRTNRNPHPLFDRPFYLQELKLKLGTQPHSGDAFYHFLAFGTAADVDPHVGFSMFWYRSKYNLPAKTHGWIDYVTGGWMFGREPNWVFDAAYASKYLTNPMSATTSTPLQGYMHDPNRDKIVPHPLFAVRQSNTSDPTKDLDGKFYVGYLYRAHRGADYAPFSNDMFDHDFYVKNYDLAFGSLDALFDYMLVGEPAGRQPNYLFDPAWYRARYGLASDLQGPLYHYLVDGRGSLGDPGPFFSTRYYLETYKDVALNGVQPLLHFLLRGDEEGRKPNQLFDGDWYRSTGGESGKSYRSFITNSVPLAASPHPMLLVSERADTAAIPAYLYDDGAPDKSRPFGVHSLFSGGASDFTASAAEIREFETAITAFDKDHLRRLKLDEPIVRMSEIFDIRISERHAAKTIDDFSQREDLTLPLVSVIMPTRNRGKVISRGIHSVLKQTYPHIELIIVDDGSTDNTEQLVASIGDERITFVKQPPTGVCAARNHGLDVARGEYFAYLDSDNYWELDYIEVMIKALLLERRDAGHAILRVFNVESGAIRYRGDVYDRPSLDRENYIDMNIFVHHRKFVDEGIRFDEDLRRCVDWDLIRRISLVSPSHFVPIVGCNYVDDSGELQRITTSELHGDFYKLMLRQIDIAPHVTGQERTQTASYSIIWPISRAEEPSIRESIWRAVHHLRGGRHELIVINNNLTDENTALLEAISRRITGFRVVHLWRDLLKFPAGNLGAAIANTDRLLFWSGHAAYDGATIDQLMDDVAQSDAIIHPVVVDETNCVLGGLFTGASGESAYQPLMGDQPIDHRVARVAGMGVDCFPVAMKRRTFDELGGFDNEFCLRLGLVALDLKAMERGADAVRVQFNRRFKARCEPSSFGKDTDARKEANWLAASSRDRKHAQPNVIDDTMTIAPLQRQFAVEEGELVALPARMTFLPRIGAGGVLRFQIMCPAPVGPDIGAWGDYHFALSMQAALRAEGHECAIRLKDHWLYPSPSVDVALHLRGVVDVKPVKGALNLMWLISHPDKIIAREVEAMAMVLASSQILADNLKGRFGIESQVMPQATDASRFSFQETAPVERLINKYVFVGNSRKVPRAIVMDAVELRLPLEVYGRDWEFYLSRRHVVQSYVPNEEIGKLYRSALCTLNDHWPTMARAGIISNRLFDVVATGGIAISDPVAGIEETFGGHVKTYSTRAELLELTSNIADWYPSIERRREASRELLAKHSFAVRARQLIDLVAHL